jgi:hypothetical protein
MTSERREAELERLYETRGEVIRELKGLEGWGRETPSYRDRLGALGRLTTAIRRLEAEAE